MSTKDMNKSPPVSNDDCECCQCGGTYEEDILAASGEEWVQCVCGSWVHEVYIYDVKFEKNEKELYFVLCDVCVWYNNFCKHNYLC